MPVEIVSPVLKGRAGIEQLKQVAEILKSLEARINVTAGLHVHLGPQSVVGDDSTAVAE